MFHDGANWVWVAIQMVSEVEIRFDVLCSGMTVHPILRPVRVEVSDAACPAREGKG